jgi:hypothetical protein
MRALNFNDVAAAGRRFWALHGAMRRAGGARRAVWRRKDVSSGGGICVGQGTCLRHRKRTKTASSLLSFVWEWLFARAVRTEL